MADDDYDFQQKLYAKRRANRPQVDPGTSTNPGTFNYGQPVDWGRLGRNAALAVAPAIVGPVAGASLRYIVPGLRYAGAPLSTLPEVTPEALAVARGVAARKAFPEAVATATIGSRRIAMFS